MNENITDRVDLKVEVANLYYRNNLSQQEIANKLKLSRPTISRILRSCIEEGIVTIQIKNVSSQQYDLAQKIKKKFGLTYVYVVTGNSDQERVLSSIGKAAAEYLENSIKGDTRIGLSAGTTLAHMVPHLQPVYGYKVDMFQLYGDANHQKATCASYLVMEFSKALNANLHAMHVPLLVTTKVLRDLLLEERPNKKHFEELQNLDMAFVGLGTIGNLLPATTSNWNDINQDIQSLKALGAVGDICGSFINKDGKLCGSEIQDHTIAIPLENLKRCPNCVGVAAGDAKKEITLAAIHGSLVNSLIIDESLASAILQE